MDEETPQLPDSVIRSMHLSKFPTEMKPLLDAFGGAEMDDAYSALTDKSLNVNNKRQQLGS